MLRDTPILTLRSDLPRQWIYDDYFDLIVWYKCKRIFGFQLCYDKPNYERALSWSEEGGFIHSAIDSGEESPLINRTPLLVSNGPFPKMAILAEFMKRSDTLSYGIRKLVVEKMLAYQTR